MRTRAKVDGNHAALVAALRACGYRVLSLAPLGHGVPDLLIHRAGVFELVEVKGPRGRLTADQERFMAEGWPVRVLRGLEEVR